MKSNSIVVGCLGAILAFSVTSTIAQSDGAAVYRKACVKCHGVEGKGDGPAAKALKNLIMGDLSSKAKMAQYADQTLYKMISEGGQAVGKSKIMLPQKDRLSDAEIKAVISHIKTLQR